MTLPRIRRVRPPYGGPPRYGPTHPMWGYPPLARRRVEVVPPQRLEPRGLWAAVIVTGLAGLAGLAAAVAEGWRFALLLRGRREVLGSAEVVASDRAVLAAGLASAILGVAAVAVCAAVLASCYRAAAQRAGVVAARGSGEIAAALLLPGWNLYAAGPLLVETVRLVRGSVPARTRRLVAAWWCGWIGGGLLAAVTAGMGVAALRWPSEQLLANQVQLHIALGLAATGVAALTVLVLLSLRRGWLGPRQPDYHGWVVAAPDTVPPVEP